MNPKVKICGITTEKDVQIINNYKPAYAGFVFYDKSKRNLSYDRARELLNLLSKDITPVAVVVSPDKDLVSNLKLLSFNILQVHGNLTDDTISNWNGAIWQAVNIGGDNMPDIKRHEKITGYVVDGANYGGGEAFDWNKSHIFEAFNSLKQNNELRILAGGLNIDNLAIGIKRFAPDVVDVSSGVEGDIGKDEEKIIKFISIANNQIE